MGVGLLDRKDGITQTHLLMHFFKKHRFWEN